MTSDALEAQPVVVDVERVRHALRTGLKGDLLAPLSYLLEQADTLVQDAEDAHADFSADLARIAAAAHKLQNGVQSALEQAPADSDLLDPSALHHHLRTPLCQIMGFCEIWLVDERDRLGEMLLERFVPDLQEIHKLSKHMLARLDDIVQFRRQAPEPAPTANDDMYETIRRILLRSRDESLKLKGAVLVVDDNECNRDLLARWLGREGHQVCLAQHGRQALDLIQQQPFDLILLDILMPEMDGVQVLQRLKADERFRHIPVIMISALDETDSVVRCIEIGAEDYLPKPFNRAVLKARIGACLEKKRLLEEIQKERRRADQLLHVILPAPIVQELKASDAVQPRRFENVAVLFCDIVGFTAYCDGNEPERVVLHLQKLIEEWEEIAIAHGVQKIKTIGDAFMAAAGLLEETADPAVLHCVRCGLDMIQAVERLPVSWKVRVGIHCGPVVAGVIGKRQYLFDLWGDTVNTAARMESNGLPGRIVLSKPAWEQIANRVRGESLGPISIKGKQVMEVYRFDGFVP